MNPRIRTARGWPGRAALLAATLVPVTSVCVAGAHLTTLAWSELQPASEAGSEPTTGETAGGDAGAPGAADTGWLAELELRLPGLSGRLSALEPGDALGAFGLAEDIAGVARDPGARDLARDLYLHAYAWGERVPAGSPMPARSIRAAAVLGLAEHEPVGATRSWLLGIAGVLDHEILVRDWTLPVGRSVIDASRYDAARAIAGVRAGRGDRASLLLALPAVRDIIDREGDVVYGLGGSGSLLATLDREAELWPCNRCRNARIIRSEGTQRMRLCASCRGDPGPELSAREQLGWLSLESRLLERTQRSWGAQLATDFGAPLREPDPSVLLERSGYDPDRTHWNGAAFVAPVPGPDPKGSSEDTPREAEPDG